MSDKEIKKKNNWKRLKGTTNFYPKYIDGKGDKVTSTSASYRTEFQSIIPHYDLSMTQTRDKGTGPAFLETQYQIPKNIPEKKAKSAIKSKKSSTQKSKRSKKKIRTDFWH